MTWQEIPEVELNNWNRKLLEHPNANIRQFPYYNETLKQSGVLWVTTHGRFAPMIVALRRLFTNVRFLSYRHEGIEIAYVCIVSIGPIGMKFGCVLDGPIMLENPSKLKTAIRDLMIWAKRNGFVALRITGPESKILQKMYLQGMSKWHDGFPFYPRPHSELYIDTTQEPEQMLAGFKYNARRKIKKAEKAGYKITIEQEPKALREAWPIFQSRSNVKGIQYQELDTYIQLMQNAQEIGAASLFVASLGERPVAAILVLRDSTTDHYFLGAVDTDGLNGAPSPTCLLQWEAIKRASKHGAICYSLGARSESVYQFKTQFKPAEHEFPMPLTITVRPFLYSIWKKLLVLVRRGQDEIS